MLSRSAALLKLATEHAHPRDARIVFDEGPHTYTVDGVVVQTSVTGLISRVETEHFDAPKIARQLSLSTRPSEKYSRVDADTGLRVPMAETEILTLWDTARDLGTDLHGKIERFLNGVMVTFTEDGPGAANRVEFLQFQAWWKAQVDAGYEEYRTEWVIFDGPNLAGSIDFVMRHRDTNEYVIVDWKRCVTSGVGFSSAWKSKKMLAPMQHLEETKLNHWKVQVNVYRSILERNYDLKVTGMMMVVLYDTQDGAVVYPHDREDAVEDLIAMTHSA